MSAANGGGLSGLTAHQRDAVVRQGNLLVAAGAGTGKTKTVVSRCLRLILEEQVSLDSILMVTFTEAAAAEMRSRIRQAFQDLLKERPDDEFIVQQLALLDNARISTLHGFCLQLIREHFYELDLDPQCAVLDEAQTRPLMTATLDSLLERHYSGTDPRSRAVQSLIRSFGRRNDDAVRAMVIRLHRYSQSLPDPSSWLDEQQRRFERAEPDEWREWFAAAVFDWCREWRDRVAAAAPNAPATRICDELLRAIPETVSFAEAARIVREVESADSIKENWPHGTIKRVRDALKHFFADAAFLKSLLPGADGEDPLIQDWNWSREQMTALVGLTREFTGGFGKAKRDLGGLDFADLEQGVLRLLEKPAVAAQWRDRLTHLFVDEYQDINEAQDAIIRALSGGKRNRFMVGDVKQSIYGFRLANPEIFCGYERQWSEEGGEGRRIPLTENFRSREGLLEFINPLFAALMRREIGGVDYDPLLFGAPEARKVLAADNEPRVELHLIVKGEADMEGNTGGEEEETVAADLPSIEREARLVVKRLKELRESGHEIWDDREQRLRAVRWSDMTVLLRSPSGRAEAFAREFSRAGVPLTAARDGFFESIEVTDLLSLLKLLDNPLQDVPLLAVLRSPLAGFSLDELATVRAHNDEKVFWLALRKFHRERAVSSDVVAAAWKKADALLTRFAAWRDLARKGSLSQCLETVLNDTHYEAMLLAGARGREQAGNVRRFLDLARQFDPYQRQGLYRFLKFVEEQFDEDMDLQPAQPPAGEAVRLMSIHKSKGLEFPVVVVAGLGSVFNERDLSGPVLLSPQFGLCARIAPPGLEQSYPGLAHWLGRKAGQRELRGEELRLLYVAMTRARDTLLLVGTANRDADKVRWADAPPRDLSTAEVGSARSCLAWLLAWLPRVTCSEDWNDDWSGRNRIVRWRLHGTNSRVFAAPKPGGEGNQDVSTPAGEDDLAALRERLAWGYPHPAATIEPAKTSVSLLRRRQVEMDGEAKQMFPFSTARTRRGGVLTAAEKGNAHHLLMELARVESLGSADGLRAEAVRLCERGVLSREQCDVLDFDALSEFWQSDLGRRIQDRWPRAQREMPFTARFTADDLRRCGVRTAIPDDEFVVVQGIADLVVVLDREIWLVDFKTDQVKRKDLDSRAAYYGPQMKLYGLALSRILGRPVTQSALYFIACRAAVPVDPVTP